MKFTEFESASGVWYVNCPASVGKKCNEWWFPARIFNIDICDYIKMLIAKYNANISFIEKKCFVMYSFKTYADAHRFVLDVNKEACKNGF